MIKVEGHNDLRRDENTHALVNVNHREYQNYLNKRKKEKSYEERIDRLSNEVQELKNIINNLIK